MALRQVLTGYEEDEDGFPMPVYDWVDDGSDDDYSNEGINYPAPVAPIDYSNEGNNYPTQASTQGAGGSPINASTASSSSTDWLGYLKTLAGWDSNKDLPTNIANLFGSPLGTAGAGLLGAYLAKQEGAKPATGGGAAAAFAPPARIPTQTVVAHPTVAGAKYAKYAADGGIMHAYKHGGNVEAQAYVDGKPLTMEDGGFVFTNRAVDNGIRRAVPQAKMIHAPGGPREDRGITSIVSSDGKRTTPARVSHGEAYVPRHAVRDNGGTQRMYALMKQFERKA